jgi:two-component system response regulator HydG
LEAEVTAGRFREDLFYRIHVFRIHLPPLRERTEDIPVLASHFLAKFAAQMGKRVDGFSDAAVSALVAHAWPGNVRELQNAIERAVVLCRGNRIETEQLPLMPLAPPRALSLAGAEEVHIRKVLTVCGFNIAQAARELDIDRVTLYNKMKKFGIEKP